MQKTEERVGAQWQKLVPFEYKRRLVHSRKPSMSLEKVFFLGSVSQQDHNLRIVIPTLHIFLIVDLHHTHR